MNCLFTAKPCSLFFAPCGFPSGHNSNMLAQLLHWCELGKKIHQRVFIELFISIRPQAHSKQDEKMKRRRKRERQRRSRQLLHLSLWIIYPSPWLCQSLLWETQCSVLFGDGDNALIGTFYCLWFIVVASRTSSQPCSGSARLSLDTEVMWAAITCSQY